MSVGTETVEVRLPPPGLAPAIVCCVWRRLQGAAAAPVAAIVPANVYACVNLLLEGRVGLATQQDSALPEFFVTGPFTRPLSTVATPPLRSVSLVVQPWLLRGWFGLAPLEMADALQDLQALPPTDAAAGLRAALHASAACAAQAERLWTALHGIEGSAQAGLPMALPELVAAGVTPAARALGLGERQYERRFGAAMGLSPRTWLRIRRFESALVAMGGAAGEDMPLAQVAAGAGYADQAHLTRAFRAGGGEPPARLRARMQAGRPGYWAFRPAHVGFVQDGTRRAG